jgi:hypothetical protein
MTVIKMIAALWYPVGFIVLGLAFVYTGLAVLLSLKNTQMVTLIATVFWVVGLVLAQLCFGGTK